MSVSITFTNTKGGVAKTSLALALSDEFSRLGKKVLLIDFDPQATLTQFFGIQDGEHPDYRKNSILRIYDNVSDIDSLNDAETIEVEPYGIKENLDIILSSRKLQAIAEGSEIGREYQLSNYLEESGLKEKYDIVIIDSPGTIGFSLVSVILASDILFIPQRVNLFDNTGTKMLFQALIEQAKNRRMSFNIGGFIPAFFESRRKTVIETNMNIIQELYEKILSLKYFKHVGNNIWLPSIRRLSVWENATDEKMFIRDYVTKRDKSGLKAVEDIEKLRDAMLEVIDNFEKAKTSIAISA